MKVQNSKLKMQSYSPKLKVLLKILFICLTFNLDKANASSLSLSVNPSIIEINAIAPSNPTSNILIKNNSDNQIKLQIRLKPFKAKSENGELEYLAEDPYIINNIRILDEGNSVDSITLDPSQQKNLTLRVNIPQESSKIDYYFSILFISDNTSNPDSNVSLNQLGIASNILLSIGAKENPSAILEDFSSKLFLEKGPIPFTIRIKNKGTHFIKPKGEIIIKNMFGQNVGKLDLTSINILSDSARTIQLPWKENFILGLYTATLNLFLSDDGPRFTRSIHFLAFPFEGLIIILVIIISAIIIKNRIKRYIKG